LAIAALKEGIVTPQTIIKDEGVIRVGSYTFYGYRRDGLGLMDVYTAIARSSNIYFYTIGGGNANSPVKEGLGPTRVAETYRSFGFGTPLGIDLPNEKSGLVPDPEWSKNVKNEPWYLGNTYHLSIGQGGLAVTPLQIHNAIATIANGGRTMRPYLVDKIETADGGLIQKIEPQVIKDGFLDAEYVKIAQDAMRLTVTDGSGRALATLPVPISGKTGTAQFDGRDLSLTHAWFTSYAPAENPQIALTVLLESGGEGSTFAVPVAREVYAWWAQNRHNIQ
jgi:penicillin-binding protein 2